MTDIDLTRCGQPRPYADSVWEGTVTANSEQAARDKLAEMLYGEVILDRQDKEFWSRPYFTRFTRIEDGKWEFRIVEEFTD